MICSLGLVFFFRAFEEKRVGGGFCLAAVFVCCWAPLGRRGAGVFFPPLALSLIAGGPAKRRIFSVYFLPFFDEGGNGCLSPPFLNQPCYVETERESVDPSQSFHTRAGLLVPHAGACGDPLLSPLKKKCCCFPPPPPCSFRVFFSEGM